MSTRKNFLPATAALLGLALNLITVSWWPVPWTDEALFLDPAANWFFTGRFTSSLWHTQSFGEFWISNAPLYSMLLAGWLEVFGFGLISARALNLFLQAVLVWLCLDWANRRLMFRPSQLILLALLLTLPNAAAFMARSGRYDLLACLVATGLVICLSQEKLIRACVLISGFLMPWVCLPALAFSASASWWMVAPHRRWRTASLHLLAAGGGFLSLAIFAKKQLPEGDFIGTLTCLWLGATGNGGHRLSSIFENIRGLGADRFWLAFTLLSGVGLILVRRSNTFWRSMNEPLKNWMRAGLSASTVCVLGYKMNILYCWMLTMPLAFIVSDWWGKLKSNQITIGIGIVAALLVLGLPLRLVMGALQQAQWAQNHEWISSGMAALKQGGGRSIVYAQWPFYYDVKNHENVVIGPRFLGSGLSNKFSPDLLVLLEDHAPPASLSRDCYEPLVQDKLHQKIHANPLVNLLGRMVPGSINLFPRADIWIKKTN